MRGKRQEIRDAENGLAERLAEPARLQALRQSGLLDTPPEEAFDRLTQLARSLLKAPVALLSLVDEHRQFFKSEQGLPEPWASQRETPLSHSFCQHVVANEDALIIADARETPLAANAAVRDLKVIAYLGVPLRDPDGHVLGSLCVIDPEPREWGPADVAALTDLAKTVMNEIILRKTLREQMRIEAALLESEAKNRLLFRELNHRVNNAVAIVQSVVRQSLRSAETLDQAAAAIEGRLAALGRAHDLLSHDAEAVTRLRALVKASTAPFRRSRAAILVDGDDVTLPSRLALMFSMALHELGTNASKYGALLSPRGRVRISWRLTPREESEPQLNFCWLEEGGPAVQRPRRRGFGTQLITRAARAQNAAVSLEYREAGLRCTIAVALSEDATAEPAAARHSAEHA